MTEIQLEKFNNENNYNLYSFRDSHLDQAGEGGEIFEGSEVSSAKSDRLQVVKL